MGCLNFGKNALFFKVHLARGSDSSIASLFKVLLARGSDPYMWSVLQLVGDRGRGPGRPDSLG